MQRILFTDIGINSAKVSIAYTIAPNGMRDPNEKTFIEISINEAKYSGFLSVEHAIIQFLQDSEEKIRDAFKCFSPSAEDIEKTVMELLPLADAKIRPLYPRTILLEDELDEDEQAERCFDEARFNF